MLLNPGKTARSAYADISIARDLLRSINAARR
jgi:hypothetical protein